MRLRRSRALLLGLACALLQLASLPGASRAGVGSWTTDAGVGLSRVDFTLAVACAGDPAVCFFLDGYADTRTSLMTGAGQLELHERSETLSFLSSGSQDLGQGPLPVYLQLDGTDLLFAGLAFYGVPDVRDPAVFAVDAPPVAVAVAGIDLLTPADHPFQAVMTWSGLGTMMGMLSLQLPEIVVEPAPATITGTLRVLGDIDLDGLVELEIRDLQASFQDVTQFVDLGVLLTVTVTADLDANLSAEVAAPTAGVPLLGPAGVLLLVAALIGAGRRGLAQSA